MSKQKWLEDPLNFVEIKNFVFLQTNPQADAWWVGHNLLLKKKVFLWYTLMGSPPESNFFILSIIDVNRRKELAESPEPRTTWSSLFGRQKQCFDRMTEQSTNDDNDG